jgi:hypothetical protein
MRKRTFLGFSRDHEPAAPIEASFTERGSWKAKREYR